MIKMEIAISAASHIQAGLDARAPLPYDDRSAGDELSAENLHTQALRMFDAHPIFGVGYLNFANQLPAFFIDTGNYSSFPIQLSRLGFAHNIYLTVLAETGTVGVVLVGALIVVGWRRAWSAARSGDWAGEGALLAFVGVGVCSAFGEVLLVPPILVAFLLAVLAAGDTTGAVRD